MQNILRVEHIDTKIGPYQCPDSDEVDELTNSHCFNSVNYPEPWNDEGIYRSPETDEFCAFKDVEQLEAWFTDEELDVLILNDFVISEIPITDIEITAIGKRQILFRYK